jgi:glutamate synthase domain-containing protein 2
MRMLSLAFTPRFVCYTLSILFAATLLLIILAVPQATYVAAVPLALFAGLSVLGTRDLLQTRHAVLRNYPISAHLRFLLEHMRPEMRQYFFEGEKDGAPFSRDKRAVVYQRAKMVLDKRPFGTQYDVYGDGFEWVHHSMVPRPQAVEPATASGRAFPDHHRRPRLHQALRRLGVQHLGHELRRLEPERHPRPQ